MTLGHLHNHIFGRLHNHGLLLAANRVLRMLLRAGIPINILGNEVYLLTVRGRKSGQSRIFAVDLYEHHDRRFLIASHGEGDWVRNLRAAGEATLKRGRHQQAIKAVELNAETAGQTLKEMLPTRLASPMRGFVLRRTLNVTSDAPLDDFINVARRCPVFELSN
jgi:deazaflavin-dependent oxidoreductase (nitroreductase family)